MSALKTTNGISVNTLAENFLERRYHEGSGIDARFQLITSFAQLSPDIVVIVDHFSNCLRKFDRQTGKIEVLTGRCNRKGGHKNGNLTKARFHRPHSVYVRVGLPDERYARDPSILYVVDTMNEALREISFRTNKVSDVLKSEMLSGFTTVFQLSGAMYIPIGSKLFDVVSATKIKEFKYIVNYTFEEVKEVTFLTHLEGDKGSYMLAVDANQLVVVAHNYSGFDLWDGMINRSTTCQRVDRVCRKMKRNKLVIRICNNNTRTQDGGLKSCEMD